MKNRFNPRNKRERAMVAQLWDYLRNGQLDQYYYLRSCYLSGFK